MQRSLAGAMGAGLIAFLLVVRVIFEVSIAQATAIPPQVGVGWSTGVILLGFLITMAGFLRGGRQGLVVVTAGVAALFTIWMLDVSAWGSVMVHALAPLSDPRAWSDISVWRRIWGFAGYGALGPAYAGLLAAGVLTLRNARPETAQQLWSSAWVVFAVSSALLALSSLLSTTHEWLAFGNGGVMTDIGISWTTIYVVRITNDVSRLGAALLLAFGARGALTSRGGGARGAASGERAGVTAP